MHTDGCNEHSTTQLTKPSWRQKSTTCGGAMTKCAYGRRPRASWRRGGTGRWDCLSHPRQYNSRRHHYLTWIDDNQPAHVGALGPRLLQGPPQFARLHTEIAGQYQCAIGGHREAPASLFRQIVSTQQPQSVESRGATHPTRLPPLSVIVAEYSG